MSWLLGKLTYVGWYYSMDQLFLKYMNSYSWLAIETNLLVAA